LDVLNNPERGYIGQRLTEPLASVTLAPAITPLDGILLMNGFSRDIKIVDDAGGVREAFLAACSSTCARHTVSTAAKQAAAQVIFYLFFNFFPFAFSEPFSISGWPGGPAVTSVRNARGCSPAAQPAAGSFARK
jgi:hypothetical protein